MASDRTHNSSDSRSDSLVRTALTDRGHHRGGEPNAAISAACLHGASPKRSGSLVAPIVQSTTFLQQRIGQSGHAYSRVSNPGVSELEELLGELEAAPPAVAFATGLAAETALFLATLRAGDHLVLGEAIYGGTVRLAEQILPGLGITATFVDSTDAAAVARAITPRTRLVFIETPANPTLRLTDIGAIAKATKAAGVLLAVDNTFLTPVLQQPLELGADISVYSTTKHIEGHSTALGGAIVARDGALLDRIRFIRKSTGAIQSPFNAWLTGRGIKTLPLRLREQSRNALRVAQFLEQHPAVAAVHYPGLASFPQADLAAKQHLGVAGETLHGGVLAFEVLGGAAAGRAVLEGVQLCSLVEHVGSVETLITHPATMTHADVRPEHRRRVGIPDGLIRLSVGLEEPQLVIADLAQAIERAVAGVRVSGAVEIGVVDDAVEEGAAA